MRIAYIGEIYPVNGETWIRYEIEELLARGHTVRVYATWPRPTANGSGHAELQGQVVLDGPQPEVVYAPEIDRVTAVGGFARLHRALPSIGTLLAESASPRWQFRVLRAVSQAARLARDYQQFAPDLTVCHFAGNRALLGSILARSARKPYVLIMHALDVWTRRPGVARYVQGAREVWTISDFNVRYLNALYPELDWSGLKVVRCGVDLRRFPFAPGAQAQPRQLVFVGRMVPMKGGDLLVRACALLRAQGWEFECHMLGGGAEREKLLALAQELGVAEIVRMPGNVPTPVVAEHLKAASAFVLPCRRDGDDMDGIPVAIMEAMAAGTPVVTTVVSGIPELVQDGVSGIVAETENPESLAAGIVRLWQMDEQQRAALLRNARLAVERLHEVRRTADQLERVARNSGPAAALAGAAR